MSLRVARSIEEWKTQTRPSTRCALTVGNFDGVHLGHQKILRCVVERARQMGALAAAVTFDPHPLRVLRPGDAPALLSTLEQRLAAFEALGLDAAIVLRFDPELSRLSPEEFARGILVEGLQACAVLVGENFRFGHQQRGDVKQLAELGNRLGFAVECITPVTLRGAIVSSTAIRSAICEGRVSRAGRWLGRPFSLAGHIGTGTGQGRHLVVPTLNLETVQELLPKTGVYVTETAVGGKIFRSATNVGFRPTFNGKRLTVESHLFDFSEELTSGPMEVLFWTRLRDEMKFSDADTLRRQIIRDLDKAQKFFRRLDRYGLFSRPGLSSGGGPSAAPRDLT
jgi:riboflavin kinase / FMN adenylyltransferase